MDGCTGCCCSWVKGIIVNHRLEGLALLFKGVIMCCRFQTWSDMNSQYSLMLYLELVGDWLRITVDGGYDG